MQNQSDSNTSDLSIAHKSLNIDPFWLSFGDLFINKFFFERGIVIVSTTRVNDEKINESGSFIINSREFIFFTPEIEHKKGSLPDARSLKKIRNTLSILSSFALENRRCIQAIYENDIVLFNKRRREEIFLPVTFSHADEPIGLYIYPWTTKPIQQKTFLGFNQFVTAGCLFGASMRAITQDGDDLALIDHHIQIRPGQKIQRIQYDAMTGNPFELTLLNEFEKTCLLINAFSKSSETNRLTYHLPAYDYILFGIKLLIQKKMTFDALDQFIQAVLVKQCEYQDKIGTISKKYGIETQFVSPFNNLLLPPNTHNPTLSILNQLSLNIEDLDSKEVDCIEQNFVQRCLALLQTNVINDIQRNIWQDFIAISDHDLNDIESLFKIANALMIAEVSYGGRDHEICSLLPLSEKQIQIGYDEYCKKYKQNFPAQASPYPHVLNITLFEPIITYSPTTNGLLFYFSCCLETLSSLIINENISLYATQNVTLFSKSIMKNPLSEDESITIQSSVGLDSVLNRAKRLF
jgi:hypothetical protein